MLKKRADLKTLVYMILATTVLVVLWEIGSLNGPLAISLFVVQLYFAVTAAVISHNHTHLPMWESKFMNTLTDIWLTLFYGFPVFAWIPTHIQNHHLYTNKEEDYTKTYAYSEKNHLGNLLRYPSYSGMKQQPAIIQFFITTYSRNKERFFLNLLQMACLIVFVGGALYLDWQKALLFIVIPQQVSLFSVLVFNYLQHIDADEESKYNHSRNFEGVLNWFLFNNGLHTIHHIHPRMHWSEIPEAHAKIRDKIDPSLLESSFWGFLFRQYILGAFSRKFRTRTFRLERIAASQTES